jgi:ubiquinone/menaquinone biosynthesis C-methylase UbiE
MNKYDYKENANEYDEQVNEYDSYSHDIIFGMSYEYVKPGETLLDLGIGTGLASIKFSKIGLKVYGLDYSEEMLNACRSKSFAEELKLHNLKEDKLPYNNDSFDHVICCGVLHFLTNLDNIFSEVERIMKEVGIFAFTFSPDNSAKKYIEQMTGWGVPIYKHSPAYINELFEKNKMKLLKEQRLLMKGADKINYDMIFSVIIAKHK